MPPPIRSGAFRVFRMYGVGDRESGSATYPNRTDLLIRPGTRWPEELGSAWGGGQTGV